MSLVFSMLVLSSTDISRLEHSAMCLGHTRPDKNPFPLFKKLVYLESFFPDLLIYC